MNETIAVEEAIKLHTLKPIIDVRTPAEFKQGHIPGAINVPLFTNEERVVVGTLYKQKGKQAAILRGLEYVGPKMKELIEAVEHQAKGENEIIVHCWRGGMRSASVAWLLKTYGYKTVCIQGGYKSFRKFVLKTFTKKHQLYILGGKTGSGKTQILQELQKRGEPIIDLEKLACHKGSSFGSLGESEPPSQEQFENLLALELQKPKSYCWMEDESRLIGQKVIPKGIWENIRTAPVVYIELPNEERIKLLVQEYGKYSSQDLKKATERIGKRLGGQHLKAALEAIEKNDLYTACKINLKYYDKTYEYGLSKREPKSIHHHSFKELNVPHITEEIIKWKKSN